MIEEMTTLPIAKMRLWTRQKLAGLSRPVGITFHGRPVAVMVPWDVYERDRAALEVLRRRVIDLVEGRGV